MAWWSLRRPIPIIAKPVSEFGVPRSNYIGLKADYDKNTADLVTARLTHSAADWLSLENDVRVAVYSRAFRYTSADACDNTIATNYCNLRLFGIAQPGAAAGSFDPTQTLVRTGGGGPYHQNSWGVQDIASANADFHLGDIPQPADRLASMPPISVPTAPSMPTLLPPGTFDRLSIRLAITPLRAPISAGRCFNPTTSADPRL